MRLQWHSSVLPLFHHTLLTTFQEDPPCSHSGASSTGLHTAAEGPYERSHAFCPRASTTGAAIAPTIAAVCPTTLTSVGPTAVYPQHSYLAFLPTLHISLFLTYSMSR